ncbi:FkbM family methyltransferase [Notoacmeibacter sp. MSK16QG-6]|uniref:FkbM family methyltransferase n=1 Tax=Notoacmeibacter sp. MSK16QG-6 TaxID=2957982 RepID=UPI0020A14DF7
MKPVGKFHRKLRRLLGDLQRICGIKTVRVDGVKICAAKGELPFEVRRLLFRGIYENKEREFVQKAVKAGDCVLELGCGIGVVSLVLTRVAGEGQVWSLEANPTLEPIIRRNYAINGWQPNLRIGAVSKTSGRVSFEVDENIISSSLAAREGNRRTIEVDAVPISELIADIRPNVIIADIEGAEIDIFDNDAPLENIRTIVLELHPKIIGAESTDDLIDSLCLRGFNLIARRGKVVWFDRTVDDATPA